MKNQPLKNSSPVPAKPVSIQPETLSEQSRQIAYRLIQEGLRAIVLPMDVEKAIHTPGIVLGAKRSSGVEIAAIQNPAAPYDWTKPKPDRMLTELTSQKLFNALNMHLCGADPEPHLTDAEAQEVRHLPGVVIATRPEPGWITPDHGLAGRFRVIAVQDPEDSGLWLTADPRITAAVLCEGPMPTINRPLSPAPAVARPSEEERQQFVQECCEIETVLRDCNDRQPVEPGCTLPARINLERINFSGLARGWASYGIKAGEVRQWAQAGCYNAYPAATLRAVGITAAEAATVTTVGTQKFDDATGKQEDWKGTVVRKFSMGMIDIDDALKVVASSKLSPHESSLAAYLSPDSGEPLNASTLSA